MPWPPQPHVTNLPRGGTLTVEVVTGKKAALVLRVADGDGRERASIQLPYPTSGYGGHEVVLGKHPLVALWLYSGQTQVGYELLELETLRHLGSLPYQVGEGEPPVFSADGEQLAMTWEAGALPRAEDLEEHERPRPGETDVVPWAELALQTVSSRTILRRTLHADLRGWRPSEDTHTHVYPEALHFVGRDELRMKAPWGPEVSIPLPLPERVVVEGP